MTPEEEQRENALADLKSAMRDIRNSAKELRLYATELSVIADQIEGVIPHPDLIGNGRGDILKRVQVRLAQAPRATEAGRQIAFSITRYTSAAHDDLSNAMTYLQSLLPEDPR